ncbi:unnamed protein product, partial [Musa acuminata var. zebrina]
SRAVDRALPWLRIPRSRGPPTPCCARDGVHGWEFRGITGGSSEVLVTRSDLGHAERVRGITGGSSEVLVTRSDLGHAERDHGICWAGALFPYFRHRHNWPSYKDGGVYGGRGDLRRVAGPGGSRCGRWSTAALPCPPLPFLPHAVSMRMCMRRSTIITLIKVTEMISGPEKEIVGLVPGASRPWPEASPCLYYPHPRRRLSAPFSPSLLRS